MIKPSPAFYTFVSMSSLIARPFLKAKKLVFGLICAFFFISSPVSAENPLEVDSLLKIVESDNALIDEKLFALESLSLLYINIDLSKSQYYVQELIRSAINSQQDSLLLIAYFTAGKVFFNMGLHDRASELWVKSASLAKNLGDEFNYARSNFNLASVYLVLQEFYMAQDYINLVNSYVTSSNEIDQELRKSYQIKILQNQALIFHKTFRFDLSKQAYLEGIALAQKNNATSDLVSLYGAYFALLLELNQLSEANDILLEMSRLAWEMNNIPKIISVNYKYGQLNFQLGQFEEAKRYLLVGDSLLKEYTSIPFEDFYAELMYKVEKELGNIDNSLYYYELSQELIKKKNLETAKNILFTMQMDEQFQAFEKKIQREVQIRKNRFWALTVVGILLIVVFIFVFVREENKLKMEKLAKYKIQLDKDRVVLLNKSLEVKMQKLSEDSEEKLNFEIQKNKMLSKTIAALQNEILKHDSMPSESFNSSANDVHHLLVWDNFLKESNTIDPGFQDRLDNLFPNLTYKDRRLCVLLKFELSTKEIANVLGQSIRSIEIARVRLRKKMGIDNSDAKLNEFIRSL